MPAKIPTTHTDLFTNPIVVTLSTVMPDGQPQATPIWCDYDGTYLYVNTAVGRQKDKNMQANPKVTISVIDPANPYRWVEVRGEVIARTLEGAAEHINKLSHRYQNRDYLSGKDREIRLQQTRVIYTVEPQKVLASGA